MARPDKVAAVAEIADEFRGASASVVTEYRGLTVTQLTTLRRALGPDVSYRIAKNTLVKRAAEDAGVDGLDALLTGPTAIAFVTGEPVDAAKALRDFAKDNKALVIKGGYMDGNALSVDEVNRIADLESREVLLAKLAGAMKGNLSKAAGLFAAPASQVARLAQALADKRAAEAAAPLPLPTPTADARRRELTPPNPSAPVPRRSTAVLKEKTMAKLSTDELLDAFKDMTLLELSEFVKKFEDTFEVTAAAPVAVAAAGRRRLPPPRPPRRRTSSTSSSRPPATRRSRSSRSSASSSRAWASRRPRTSSRPPRSRSWRAWPKEAADAAKAKLEDAGAKVSLA